MLRGLVVGLKTGGRYPAFRKACMVIEIGQYLLQDNSSAAVNRYLDGYQVKIS